MKTNKIPMTDELFGRIYFANERVLGTTDYAKYKMCNEVKYKVHGKWTNWRFVGWGIPHSYEINGDSYIKKVKDRYYLMTSESDTCMVRWEITPEVRKLWNL